jgi:putative ABC transport system permease protein
MMSTMGASDGGWGGWGESLDCFTMVRVSARAGFFVGGILSGMSRDRVRQSLRTLARQKRFAVTAILCLGVAIALNTTMYSVLDGLISPRSEVKDPERLHQVAFFGDYLQMVPQHEKVAALLNASFHEGVATYYRGRDEDQLIERNGELREIISQPVSANFFALHGLRPLAGRLLNERDSIAQAQVVVLGERLWRQLFPEMKEFQPARVLLGGSGKQVVGVLSKNAGFPYVDVWMLPPQQVRYSAYYTRVVRRKVSVSEVQAQAELDGISQRFRLIAGEDVQTGWRFRPAHQPAYREWNFRYALIGSVLAVLLIGCANLANLQLARGVSRARELATRAAVGATRGDIIWQLVLESGWLALGGLAVGAVLAAWGIWLIDHYIPREVAEYMTYPQVSWRVVLFAVVASLLCLALVGLVPAIRLSRVDINELLKSGAGTGKSRGAKRQYGALVIVEVSLALALLCSTALLVRSAMTVRSFDYRDEFRHIVSAGARIQPEPGARVSRRYWSEAIRQQALRTDSVTMAATSVMSCPSRHAVSVYDRNGHLYSMLAQRWCYTLVSSDFFRVQGIPIIRGRDFAPGEFAGLLAVVDSVAALTLWPGQNPIGQQLKLDSARVNAPWVTVIGVANERRRWFSPNQDAAVLERVQRNEMGARAERIRGNVWVLNSLDTTVITSGTPQNRGAWGSYIALGVRSRGDNRRLPLELRNKLAELGPQVIPSYPRTWEQWSNIGRLRAKHDFMASLFVFFALMALGLAALGVYAIIAHMVAQRTREFGLRIAVGAGEREIRQIVVREGNILTLLGIAVGLILTWKSAAWVRAFVFSDWDRYDSRVFALVALVLFATAWLASYLPARKAMRINPVEALRND